MTISEMIPATEIEVRLKIPEALNLMKEKNVALAVIKSLRGEVLGVISAESLSGADEQKRVEALVSHAKECISIEAPKLLEDIVLSYSKELELHPNIAWIVLTERNKVRGLIAREIIIKQTRRVVTRGSGIDRLEGSPLDTLIYRCLKDNESKMVAYYDPKDPPRCSHNHDMVPDE